MRSQRGDGHAAAVTAAWLALSLGARATWAADSEPIRLHFEAPAGCPGEEAFLDQVRARTVKARLAAAGEKARTFSVRLTQEGRAIRGRLTIEESADPTGLREVTGERCAEVVSALALITALAVDPQASTAPPARLPPTGSEVAAPGGSSAPAVTPPRSQLPPNHPAPYLPPRSFADLDVVPLPVIPGVPEMNVPRWRFSVGMGIAVLGGMAPSLSAGSTLFLEAARIERSALMFAPSIRLTASQVDSGYVSADTSYVGPTTEGRLRFQLRMARAEFCPVRFVFAPGASLGACASLDVGAVLAEGWGSSTSESRLRPWVASGAGWRLRWAIINPLELQIEGGGSFPLFRDTFFFAPETDVHTVASVAGWLAGGVGVRFY